MPDFRSLVRAHLGPLPVDPAREADIVDELAQHVAEHHRDLVREGRSEEEAIAMALAPLRDRAHVATAIAREDRVRAHAPAPPAASNGASRIGAIARDVQYAVRVLRRSPGFAATAILTLALGIGAPTTVFSIVNAVLLRPLPFEASDRLVRLFHVPPQNAFPGTARFPLSPANFYDWKARAQSFDAMAIYRVRSFTLTGTGTADAVLAGTVGADFFETVGARPALGRVFTADEDSPEHGRVAILSDGFWKSHFAAARDVVGRTLALNGEPYTIVGVMPAHFSVQSWGGTACPLWVPLAYTPAQKAVRENHNAQAIARVKPGVTLAQAESELAVIAKQLEQAYPKENAGWGATIVTLQELIVGGSRRSLVVLFGAVGLVLLIACANVGNLLFTRALTRQKELAIRSALGAGRGRVFQQLLMEALVIALAGGAAGLLLAQVSLSAGATLLASQLPRADEISLDARVLAFVVAASIVTTLLAGVLPARRAGRADLNDALKEGGRHDGAIGVRTRRALIVCEVALSLMLLMGAGVMFRTLLALRNTDAGIDPHNVLTMSVSLPATRYDTPAKRTAYFDAALQRLRALPGVEAAAAVDDLPAQGGSVQYIVPEGTAERLPSEQPTAEVRHITPGYLQAMRIPLLSGRDIRESDTDVLLVSVTAAKLLWGDADPIGRRARLPLESSSSLREVIGIVGEVKHAELSKTAAPTVYHYTRERAWNSMSLVARTAVAPATLAHAAAATLRELDPGQPIQNVRTMEEVLDSTMTSQRFNALLLAIFASVALILASVGIYSVLSYIVRSRTHEIGVRTALGARTTDVLRLVVLEGMTPAAIGIAVGVVAALASAQALSTLVFGISASDPATLVLVGATLALVSFVASVVPAYRASRLDPLKVLRSE